MKALDLDELRQIVELAMDKDIPPLESGIDLYEGLGMDSIGAVAMIVELQRRYRVRIREEDVPLLRTPNALLVYVNSQTAH